MSDTTDVSGKTDQCVGGGLPDLGLATALQIKTGFKIAVRQ